MSASAYDALAQQCGLLNGSLNPAASPNSSSKLAKSSSSRPPSASTITTTTSSSGQSSKSMKIPSRDAQIQNLLLPPDTQILESLSKASGLDPSSLKQKSDKKEDKRKALESLRGILPSDFTTTVKDKKGGLSGLTEFTKLLEAQVSSQATKKSQEQQMKEAIEQLSKVNPDLMAKAVIEEQPKPVSMKRPRDSTDSVDSKLVIDEETQPTAKKAKEDCQTPGPSTEQEGVDIETLLPPSTVVKPSTSTAETAPSEAPFDLAGPSMSMESESQKEADEKSEDKQKEDQKDESAETLPDTSPPKKAAKRTRGKRKSGDLPPLDPEAVVQKKNLRSSASRSAAAAAARQKLEAENALKESEGGS